MNVVGVAASRFNLQRRIAFQTGCYFALCDPLFSGEHLRMFASHQSHALRLTPGQRARGLDSGNTEPSVTLCPPSICVILPSLKSIEPANSASSPFFIRFHVQLAWPNPVPQTVKPGFGAVVAAGDPEPQVAYFHCYAARQSRAPRHRC